MLDIHEHQALRRQLGGLPAAVRKRYEIWKEIAGHSGLDGIAAIRGFREARLKGDWAGWRSARLGPKHRVVYRYAYRKFFTLFFYRA